MVWNFVLPALVTLATTYNAYNQYKDANAQRKQLREQNARNAKIHADNIRRARAQNLAALSSSGLATRGTPYLQLQEDDQMAWDDYAYQRRQDAYNQRIASYNTRGTLWGGVTDTANTFHKYGDALKEGWDELSGSKKTE